MSFLGRRHRSTADAVRLADASLRCFNDSDLLPPYLGTVATSHSRLLCAARELVLGKPRF